MKSLAKRRTLRTLSSAALVGAPLHDMCTPVERGHIGIAPVHKRFPGKNCPGKALLTRQLGGQRFEHFAMTAVVCVVEKSVMTVAVVVPPGMIDDRVQTDAEHWHVLCNCR